MAKTSTTQKPDHIDRVLDYYSDRTNIGVNHTDARLLYERYLSKAMTLDELKGKRILELGAGCSQYVPLFLDAGCAEYYANDLIPERLVPSRVADPRYHEIPGDFLTIGLPDPVDITFASLTMMCLQPLFVPFAKRIFESLKPGGVFISMEANYFCPLNIYRNMKPGGSNHTGALKMFNPFSYAKIFREHGFEIELMLPFTGPYSWTTGFWPVGTAFWMRARKPVHG
jgi:SAM-dependent methyltransferase